MRFTQLVAPRTSEVVEAPDPEPGPGEVLVRVEACGVCASELHPWRAGTDRYPRRFGHEAVGVVATVGPAVAGLRAGDRVTGLFFPAFADVAVAKAANLLLAPDGVPTESALGEPLACLINAMRRTPLELAARVAIVGLGYMGLGVMQLARLRGPSRIVAIEVRAEARALALDLGADEALHPDELPPEYVLTNFGDWNSDRGFDVVFEAAGAGASLDLAGRLVGAHGVLSIVGFHQGGPRSVDVGMWNWKAIDVVNAHVRRHADLLESMRIGLALTAAGRIDLGRLVSHRYGLDGVDRAFSDLESKPPGFVKAVVYA
jgi:threonine dehydrogenase-like Zn-dependent dehydrogenase